MKDKWLLMGFLALASSAALSQTNYNDTVNCRWKDGRDMDESNCAFFRRRQAEDQADEAAHKLRTDAQLAAQRSERQAQEKASAERLLARDKELERLNEIDRQKQLVQDKTWAQVKARLDREEVQQQTARNNLKKQCGDDYNRPAVGLKVDRFSACVAPIKATGQLNRADAVVTTYRGGGYIVHAIDGRVVAWTR